MNATSNPARMTARKQGALAPQIQSTNQVVDQIRREVSNKPSQEALTAFDFLDRIQSLFSHTEGLILSTLETDRFHANCVPPVTPLPDWARDRLMDQGRLEQAALDFRTNAKALRTSLQLAIEGVTSSSFEIWIPSKEAGYVRRFSTRIESLELARQTLAAIKGEFPSAYIAVTNRRSRPRGTDDLALMSTLLGRVSIEGTFFQQDDQGDIFEVEDETGRVVNVSATVLADHAIFERLSQDDKAKVEYSISRVLDPAAVKGGAL